MIYVGRRLVCLFQVQFIVKGIRGEYKIRGDGASIMNEEPAQSTIIFYTNLLPNLLPNTLPLINKRPKYMILSYPQEEASGGRAV